MGTRSFLFTRNNYHQTKHFHSLQVQPAALPRHGEPGARSVTLSNAGIGCRNCGVGTGWTTTPKVGSALGRTMPISGGGQLVRLVTGEVFGQSHDGVRGEERAALSGGQLQCDEGHAHDRPAGHSQRVGCAR
jgi:hypothetical protein